MSSLSRVASGVFALAVLAGCAQTNVTSRQTYEGGPIARPARIIVHDFAATPADIPAGSAVAGQYAEPTTPQTPEETDLGRKLGAQVAQELVAEIQGMGLPAVRAQGQPATWQGDIVLMGYFESVDSGSAVKRMVLGFGQGAADLKTVVEGYLMTDQGLRRLGSGTVDSGTGKAPDVAVPLVMAAATGNPIGLIISQRREGGRPGVGADDDRGHGQADGQGDRRPAPGGVSATGVDLSINAPDHQDPERLPRDAQDG